MYTLLRNAILILPDQIISGGWLLIEDERIADLGESGTCPNNIKLSIDVAEQYVMPGLIDLHCDAIERLVEPRPNVYFDMYVALKEADWRLAGCGITTEFHAVSLDDGEFGVRSNTFVRNLCQAIRTETDVLIRHKVHARLELSSQSGSEIMAEMIARREADLVSLMDHSPGQGQYANIQAFRDYVARTTSKSYEEIDALLEMKRVQSTKIPARIERTARLAREAGLALATHDDDTATKVEQWPKLGVTVSEFPTTMEAASRAHELGLAVCMGAPNVLRGTSSGGNLSAIDAIQAGIADVLCSDYYPAAMLGALFKLATQQVLTLPQATQLVTLNPAKAVGLGRKYGSLEVGKMADVIVMRLSQQGVPRVQRVFVDGNERIVRA